MKFQNIELGTEFVTLAVEEGVALISLNRPKQLNAISSEMTLGLLRAFETVAVDETIVVAILTGKGNAFSVGVDLVELSHDAGMMQSDALGVDAPLMKVMASCSKPIIAAVNGFAVTGGFELALACDLIYASDSAKFADTHAQVGLIPGGGLSQKLPRLIGINRAREVSFTGQYFSSDEAYAWGLVNKVYSNEKLMDGVMDVARQISTSVPGALYKIKSIMNCGWEMSLGESLRMEGETAIAHNSSMNLADMEERLTWLRSRARPSN